MTQEDKQLLLKDISARLPYGVKCIVTKSRTEEGQEGDVRKIGWVCLEGVDCINDKKSFFVGILNDIKPRIRIIIDYFFRLICQKMPVFYS